MKTIEEFYNEIKANTELAEAAFNAQTENRLAQFLNEHEVDGTEEAFAALVKEKLSSRNELSDEDIEQVVGGMEDWRNDYYIRNHNERGMIMYIANLAYSDQKLFEPKTNTTFTITVVSRQSPGEFKLTDVEGKRMTRTHTAYTLYTKIKKHNYLLPWDR